MGARLGWGEVVIIIIIALIVLGPEKLPSAGRALGKAIRGVKKYVSEAARELEDFDDIKDIKDDVEGIQKDLKSMGRSIEKSVNDDMSAVEKDLKTAGEDIRTAVEQEDPDTSEASETKENAAVPETDADAQEEA